jgi:hypothetical protein
MNVNYLIAKSFVCASYQKRLQIHSYKTPVKGGISVNWSTPSVSIGKASESVNLTFIVKKPLSVSEGK